ncbi:MAG: DUF262 domain-containing protein [Candidatus Glassbacteria bacterium]
MDTQLLTLSKIFTERLFRIPDYQRGYAWTEKQLKDFWTDIQQLESGRNHYTGVLTLESVPEDVYRQWDDDYWIVKAKSFQPYFVVDGQQRLTTAIILIQVILEHLPDGEKLNYTEKADIQRKFIFDSKDDGISRSYVFGYEKDNPSYEFLKTKVFYERSSTATSQETVYTLNLTQAKQYFSDLVAALSRNQLETLYRKVTQHLLFNIFTITEDVDVCVAFETMNNRGKPLSYLELLKNRLIYLSLKFSALDFERGKLRRAINDCWKAIYHNLGKNKENPLDDDRFLLTHYVIYFGKEIVDESAIEDPIRYRRLYHEDYASDLLEKRFIPKNVTSDAAPDVRISLADVYRYVSSLQEAVETWYKMYNPFTSDFSLDIRIWLDKLNRIGMDPFQPLVLVFLQRVPDERKQIAFLQAVERHMFILSLVERYYHGYPYLFELSPNILQLAIDLSNIKITGEKVTRAISDATGSILKDANIRKAIQARFRSEGFYEWQGIRYFLFEYNLDLQSRSKTERPKIFWPEFTEHKSDFVSIEHIYPQQARHQYWRDRFDGLTQNRRMTLKNSLGNLLPLSKPKNSSLSNRPCPEKVDGKGDQFVGYRYGCYAENEVAKVSNWNPQAILERGLVMLSFMETRWGIELGDTKQKKHMLGLDFLGK